MSVMIILIPSDRIILTLTLTLSGFIFVPATTYSRGLSYYADKSNADIVIDLSTQLWATFLACTNKEIPSNPLTPKDITSKNLPKGTLRIAMKIDPSTRNKIYEYGFMDSAGVYFMDPMYGPGQFGKSDA